MLERKPLAALSSGLLARKGQAKPAMRRQFAPFEDFHHDSLDHDDLGWNDMGDDHEHAAAAPVPFEHREPAVSLPVEDIAQQQARLTESFGAFSPVVPAEDRHTANESEKADALVVPGSMNSLVRRPVYEAVLDRLRGERRVALTLRIERNRHGQLRTLMDRTGASAQALLAQALDEFLDRHIPAQP